MNHQMQEQTLLSDAELDAVAGGLEEQGLDVVVAATTTEVARPHAAAICNGVSVLAWARVDGESILGD